MALKSVYVCGLHVDDKLKRARSVTFSLKRNVKVTLFLPMFSNTYILLRLIMKAIKMFSFSFKCLETNKK